MIEIDTYINILFAIIIPSIGVYISIIMNNNSHYKKRNLLFILFFTSIILIIIATLIYCYDRYIFISDILPFSKPQFSDSSYNYKYKNVFTCLKWSTLLCCILIILKCGNINENGYGVRIFYIKYAIIALLFYLIIGTYVHLWLAYLLCNLLGNLLGDLSSNYAPYSLIVAIVSLIEYGILYYINTYLTYKKLAQKRQ